MPKLKRKRTKTKPRQTEMMMVRLTSEDSELFREAAQNDDRTLSNWVRHVLRKAAKENK